MSGERQVEISSWFGELESTFYSEEHGCDHRSGSLGTLVLLPAKPDSEHRAE